MNLVRYHTHPRLLPRPSRNISIRPPVILSFIFLFDHISGSVQEEKYAVIDITKSQSGTILEELETSRAMFEVYEGGVVRVHSSLTVRRIKHPTVFAPGFNVHCRFKYTFTLITMPRRA